MSKTRQHASTLREAAHRTNSKRKHTESRTGEESMAKAQCIKASSARGNGHAPTWSRVHPHWEQQLPTRGAQPEKPNTRKIGSSVSTAQSAVLSGADLPPQQAASLARDQLIRHLQVLLLKFVNGLPKQMELLSETATASEGAGNLAALDRQQWDLQATARILTARSRRRHCLRRWPH